MKSYRICIATYSLSYGGVGTFILNLADSFTKKGHQCEILTTTNKGKWFSKALESGYTAKNFSFGILGWIPFGRVFHSLRVGLYLRKKKYDLIILNGSLFSQYSMILYKRTTKVISVFHVNVDSVIKSQSFDSKNIDLIICVSPIVYENSMKLIPADKLININNGVPVSDIKELNNRIEFSMPLKLLFVGRLENKHKGIYLLPEIISELNKNGVRVKLTIAGIGPDEANFKQLIHDFKVNNEVNLLGLIEPDKIFEVYKNNHVLILPSYFEGLPLTLMEAMAWGCVPICSNLIGSTDVCVDDGINGFLTEIGNKKNIVNCINDLINHPENWTKMSQNSVSKANEDFSLHVMVEKYLEQINLLFQNQKTIRYEYSIDIFKMIIKESVPFNFVLLLKKILRIFRV